MPAQSDEDVMTSIYSFCLDLERAKEKVEVHYEGDASRLLTVSRGGILLDTSEQIRAFIETMLDSFCSQDGGEGMQVVHIDNRFEKPAASGYRDFKAYLRAKDGFISTFRVASRQFERATFFETSKYKWQMAGMQANTYVRAGGCDYPIVLVGDNYLLDEDDSLHMVAGFMSDDDAIRYGLSRILGSLAELKNISRSFEELVDNWLLFGENVSVQLRNGYINFDNPLEARIVDCDLQPERHWKSDLGEKYFKAPIFLRDL